MSIIVDLRKCTFSWTIDQYSTHARSECDLKSSTFSAIGDNFKWHLTHKIRKFYPDSPDVVLYLHPDLDDLRKYGTVSVNVQVFLVRHNNPKLQTTPVSYKFDWHGDMKECYVGSLGYVFQTRHCAHEDKLKLICELSYSRKPYFAYLPSSCCSKPDKISESNLSTDFERFFIDDDNFKDATISVTGKNYPVHKTVLAARSSVFNAMFKSNMEESQKNHIVITDIEQEPFEEMLHYIYTGKTKNLQELAFELLPAADKYDLRELKTMCEEVLLRKLSTDNAARILILADMHRAEDLKASALRFMKMYHSKCKDFKETEVWNIVTGSRPHLMKDLLDVIFR
ncbi:speckle-type POZ protein B-like [Planococcus citri]|uniref:speckle-type POZ protein B-like n=1 Tax=Planococcus citri TaxID=170843 RepID=UPI0031F99B31